MQARKPIISGIVIKLANGQYAQNVTCSEFYPNKDTAHRFTYEDADTLRCQLMSDGHEGVTIEPADTPTLYVRIKSGTFKDEFGTVEARNPSGKQLVSVGTSRAIFSTIADRDLQFLDVGRVPAGFLFQRVVRGWIDSYHEDMAIDYAIARKDTRVGGQTDYGLWSRSVTDGVLERSYNTNEEG